MLIAARGGPSETKKDTAQNSKPIEITDVTGRTVTLKKPAERVVLQWSGAGGPFFTISALMGKDTPKGYCRYGYIFAGLQGGYVEALYC